MISSNTTHSALHTTHKRTAYSSASLQLILLCMLFAMVILFARQSGAQSETHERTFRQSKNAVERALKELQPSMSGRLPALEGFATAGDHPLDRYQRAFYQSDVHLTSTPSGGTVVRVTTKVTAWYTDSAASRSGYQIVSSNGRLESDLLDQLSEALSSTPTTSTATTSSPTTSSATSDLQTEKKSFDRSSANSAQSVPPNPSLSPVPKATVRDDAFRTSSLGQGLSPQQLADSKNAGKPLDPAETSLQAEAASLEEVLKNLAHPKNLVAIKKSGTPVVSSPSLNGKNLFLATAHDEFEMLDFNNDWVHVRISGLARGWIWRTSLEMPEGISDIPQNGAKSALVAADLFQVTREETAPFPGDWGPLRGKNVRIISVQKIQENEKDSGAQAKLEYAKSLIDKNYADLAAKAQELSGIVLIFDSVDGGMIAATFPTVQQWKAGTLSDSALWHQCYFDPPETFTVSTSGGSN